VASNYVIARRLLDYVKSKTELRGLLNNIWCCPTLKFGAVFGKIELEMSELLLMQTGLEKTCQFKSFKDLLSLEKTCRVLKSLSLKKTDSRKDCRVLKRLVES
jgi:hypothetical protein